jgi:hypothetical protein
VVPEAAEQHRLVAAMPPALIIFVTLFSYARESLLVRGESWPGRVSPVVCVRARCLCIKQ